MAAGWVPCEVQPGAGVWNSYQESLHLILAAAPAGPSGARLLRCLLRCDPRSVVVLADMIRKARSGR